MPDMMLVMGSPKATDDLLDLTGLRVSAVGRPNSRGWVDVEIEVHADPFSGTLSTVFTVEDLRDFAGALSDFDSPGRVELGGGRAALLTLDVEDQLGGAPDCLAIEAAVTPSEDDPWPILRFLIFGVGRNFGDVAAASIEAFLDPQNPR